MESESEKPETVAERFRAVAARHWDRPAVNFNGAILTYRDLDANSENLSRLFSESGESNPEPVGILLARRDQILTGCLAAMKAGRPFVCLSLDDSEARRSDLLRRVGARSLLRNDPEGPIVPGRRDENGLPLPRLTIEQLDWPGDDRPIREERPYGDAADDPVMIVHTSGSTGAPLSVARSHRNILHNIDHLTRVCGITPDDRITMLIPPTFGASFNDVFLAILNGACLFPFDVKAGGYRSLRRWFQENLITFCHCVPTLFRSFCHGMPDGLVLSSVRCLRMGGEPLHRSDVELMRRHFPEDCRLVNCYSMTESAGSVAELVINHGTVIETPTVPVGYPVKGREILLFDEEGHVTPNLQAGEIVIRSRYLCSSYLSNPEMSAVRFARSDEDPATILLRTGDLGRFDEQGRLHHLGRKDDRVKLRGKRVDLAEIEAAFSDHEGIARFAAVLVEQASAEGEARQKLVGFAVPLPNRTVNANQLISWGRERLPESAVPAEIRLVDEFPLRANGKVDRKALAGSGKSAIVHFGSQPRSEIEQTIAEVWKRHLKLDHLGVYDAFYEMGGDSLSALAVCAEISEAFQVEIPAHSLATVSSVAALAEFISSHRKQLPGQPRRIHAITRDAEPVVTLQSGGEGEPVIILPGGAGGELELTAFARTVPYLDGNHPVLGFRASCLENLTPRPDRVEQIATLYLKSIPVEHRTRRLILLGNCLAGQIAFEMARQLVGSGLPCRLILNDCRTPCHRSRFGRFGNFEGWDENAPPATALQHYLKTLVDYRPGSFPGDLYLIVSDEYAQTDDPSLGWSEHVEGRIVIRRISGSHIDSIRGVAGFGKALAEIIGPPDDSPDNGQYSAP